MESANGEDLLNSISCSLMARPLPTREGSKQQDGNGTLEIAVVMTAVTDASVLFVPGSSGRFTSSRVVLYCTLAGKKGQRNKQKKNFFFKLLRLNHRTITLARQMSLKGSTSEASVGFSFRRYLP